MSDWEEQCMDVIGLMLATIDKFGAIGGDVSLFTDDENIANIRVERLKYILSSDPQALKFDKLFLNEEFYLYEVTLLK